MATNKDEKDPGMPEGLDKEHQAEWVKQESLRQLVSDYADAVSAMPIIMQLEFAKGLLLNRDEFPPGTDPDPVILTTIKVIERVIDTLAESPKAASMLPSGEPGWHVGRMSLKLD